MRTGKISSSAKQKVASVQCAELHVLEDKRVIVVKTDDHIVATLVAMGAKGGELGEEFRDVDDIATSRPRAKITNARHSRTIFDVDEIIAAPENT